MNNKAFIVDGLDAAILDAEINTKTKCKVSTIPKRIMWEDASEEMRNDPKVMWHASDILFDGKKYCYSFPTKEEREEIKAYKQQRLIDEFNYILNKYGWEYAERFYHIRKHKFEKYNIEIDLKIPHCKYNKENQCDITCPFFNGQCSYEEFK